MCTARSCWPRSWRVLLLTYPACLPKRGQQYLGYNQDHVRADYDAAVSWRVFDSEHHAQPRAFYTTALKYVPKVAPVCMYGGMRYVAVVQEGHSCIRL